LSGRGLLEAADLGGEVREVMTTIMIPEKMTTTMSDPVCLTQQ
jgi:hypothetical protein